MSGLEDLRNLRSILNSSLDTIIGFCEERNVQFPSLFDPAELSDEFSPSGIRNAPELAESIALGVSAAAQLVATLQSPSVTILSSSLRHILSTCISAVERLNVPEIVRESGKAGAHVEKIAAETKVDPKKLARILRYLSTNYIFKEVHPDVFAHNLVSSILDTGKSYEEIAKDPISKFDGTAGIQAFCPLSSEDTMKASVHLLAHLTDPSTAFSDEQNVGPIQRAFSTSLTYWDMIEQPGNENLRRFKRIGAAMEGSTKTQPPEAILQIFDWEGIPEGGMLVDVGAGLGNISLAVANVRPDMQFLLEDRPQVIERAKLHWNNTAPDLVASGRVHFNAFDLFQPHPSLPSKPDILLLRIILHDWSDKYAIQLLTNLRKIAHPDTKLLVVDTIMAYSCVTQDIGDSREPPKPLLSNLGAASIYAYDMDLVMMLDLNATERTLADFRSLFAKASWELKEVHRHPSNNKMLYPGIVAVPA